MLFLPIVLLAAQLSGITALPLASRNNQTASPSNDQNLGSTVKPTIVHSTAAPKATQKANKNAAANATQEAAKAGEEIELPGVFGQVIQLGGGNVKTDVLFTKGEAGALEVEFQDDKANALKVTENKTPAAPPTGFLALEKSSFKVELANGSKDLTLQKIDFVVDAASQAVQGIDVSKGKIGKLCKETNTFVIDDALGELEFEVEENELSLTVKDMIGEWGVFIPADNKAANQVDAKAQANADEQEIAGEFDKAVATPAGNKKTDILFTESEAGKLEVEVNATAANAITVKLNESPAPPPDGFLFVDPATFQISTDSATDPKTDVVKVDYIFSQAILDAVDVKQGIIGKLDPETNKFIVDTGLLKAEFEFEEEENEWSLTVPDLNGEWAILIPQAALRQNGRRSVL